MYIQMVSMPMLSQLIPTLCGGIGGIILTTAGGIHIIMAGTIIRYGTGGRLTITTTIIMPGSIHSRDILGEVISIGVMLIHHADHIWHTVASHHVYRQGYFRL